MIREEKWNGFHISADACPNILPSDRVNYAKEEYNRYLVKLFGESDARNPLMVYTAWKETVNIRRKCYAIFTTAQKIQFNRFYALQLNLFRLDVFSTRVVDKVCEDNVLFYKKFYMEHIILEKELRKEAVKEKKREKVLMKKLKKKLQQKKDELVCKNKAKLKLVLKTKKS